MLVSAAPKDSAQQPSDLDAEMAVLGSILLDPSVLRELAPRLRPQDFYRENNALVYKAALQLQGSGKAIDQVTLASQLQQAGMLERIGGRASLASMQSAVPTAANAGHYADIVIDKARRRRALTVLDATRAQTLDEQRNALDVLSDASKTLASVRVELDGPLRPLEVSRVGLGYRATAPAGLEIRLDRVRASSRDVRGQLTLRWSNPSQGQEGHIFGGNVNVSSPTERTTVARECARSSQVDFGMCRELLERFCMGVLADLQRAPDVLNLATLHKRSNSPTLLGPMLPLGHISTLMGKEGEGKSTLARAIAVSVWTGHEVIPGWRPNAVGSVLVLDYEADEYDWAEGIADIAAGCGIATPPPIDYMACAWRGALSDQIEAISARVAELQPVLVLLDSAELAAGAGVEHDSFEARTQRLYAALKLLKTTVAVIDHLSGAERSATGPATKPYGSVFKAAWSRQVWELKREKEPEEGRAELLLINTKYNAGRKSKPIGLAFNYTEGRIEIERTDVLAPELLSSLPIHERMMRLLRNGAMTTEALAEALDKPANYVRQIAARHRDRFVRLPDRTIGLTGFTNGL